MDIRLSEFQELLRTNAEDFLTREVPTSRIREIEKAGEPDAGLWQQMTELGWTGLLIAEQYGGQGGSLTDSAVLIQQLCRAAMLTPFQNTVVSAATIQKFASDDLKQTLLPRIAAGAVATPAAVEQSGVVGAPAEATAADGTVSGRKFFVEYAQTADLHLVTAVQDGTPGIAIVARDQGGVSAQDLKSVGATPQSIVTYENAAMEGFIPGSEAVDYLRMLGAAIAALECYSHAQKSLDMAVDYTQMRVQFGQPIGAFEAVQQRVADMAIQVEASKYLTHELIWSFDDDSVNPDQVPVVKAITARAVTDVTMWSHVLHGGLGYMEEYDLQFHTRRGKEAALRWGGMRESMTAIANAALA